MKTHGSATTFRVSDLEAAIAFYTDIPGFEKRFQFGDYAGVAHEGVQIHLAGPSVPNARTIGHGGIYIFCDDVDAYHAEITSKGVTLQAPPKDYEYGMRDFVMTDPDGNLIGFGQEISNG